MEREKPMEHKMKCTECGADSKHLSMSVTKFMRLEPTHNQAGMIIPMPTTNVASTDDYAPTRFYCDVCADYVPNPAYTASK